MRFERTGDLNLVKRILTHPAIWPGMSDDSSPAPAAFKPVAPHEGLWYVLAYDAGELLGLFIFVRKNAACWEVHDAILPAVRGKRAFQAAIEGREWFWDHSDAHRLVGAIPEYNKAAIWFAKKTGFTEYGRNPEAYCKDRQYHAVVMMGVTRPESCQRTADKLTMDGEFPPLIFCCGMGRSGGTVTYQIAAGILELRGIGDRGGYYEPPISPPIPTSGFRVYKVPFLGRFERDLIRKGAITLYSHRDLDEAVASATKVFDLAPEKVHAWRELARGHHQDMLWMQPQGPNIHFIEFERIRDKLRSVIEDLAGWLPGRPLTTEEIDELEADLCLEHQKARPRIYPADPHTLLFATHFDNAGVSAA